MVNDKECIPNHHLYAYIIERINDDLEYLKSMTERSGDDFCDVFTDYSSPKTDELIAELVKHPYYSYPDIQ